jgi:hypothetical protein
MRKVKNVKGHSINGKAVGQRSYCLQKVREHILSSAAQNLLCLRVW